MLLRMLALAMWISDVGRAVYLRVVKKVHSSRVRSREEEIERSRDILELCAGGERYLLVQSR